MPLLSTSSIDDESFDTFDVAKMADIRGGQTQRGWFSRRGRGGASDVASTTARHHPQHQGVDLDDVMSLDSSSRRSDAIGSAGSNGGSGSRSNNFGGERTIGRQHSFNSVGASSYMSTSHQSSYTCPSSSYSVSSQTYGHNHRPMYEENLDETQYDPRTQHNMSSLDTNSYNGWGQHGQMKKGGFIAEEDETESLSTTEDSSFVQPQQRNNPNQTQQHSSHNPQHQNPHHKSDDSSSVSSPRPDAALKNSVNESHASSSYTSQLEAQIAKLNFELATTKSSMDELKLDHRRLQDEKDALTNNYNLLQEENVELQVKIERLEKERLVRNMEGTVGISVRHFPNNEGKLFSSRGENSGKGKNAGENSMSNRFQARFLQRTMSGGSTGSSAALEVPFKQKSNYESFQYDNSTSERGESDADDAHSVELSVHSYNLNDDAFLRLEQEQQQQNIEQQQIIQQQQHTLYNGRRASEEEKPAGRGKGFAWGMGNKQSHRKKTILSEDASTSSSSQERAKREQKPVAATENDVKYDSDEEYDSDDPFATCYPKKEKLNNNGQKKWFQRSSGGGNERESSAVKQSVESAQNIQNGCAEYDLDEHNQPTSDETVQDPFDSCYGSQNDRGSRDHEIFDESYVSFSGQLNKNSNTRLDKSEESRSTRKGGGFNLFRGFRGQQGRR